MIQLSNLLVNISQDAGIKTKKKRTSGMAKNHKIWFDKECADKRSEQRKLGKQASREPKSSKTRMDLDFKKKTFKNLYRGKSLFSKMTS